MQEFDDLLAVAERLLGPNGCPWDLTQTFLTLQTYVLEEAHEVVDAVDRGNDDEIAEELGDLLYTVVFYAVLAKKEGRFTIQEIVTKIKEKLIRRHPHVFGKIQANTVDEIVANWESIKKQEKKGKELPLSEIPATLPALIRAQKVVRKLMRTRNALKAVSGAESQAVDETGVGARILREIVRAEEAGIDAEGAVRRALRLYEEEMKK